MLQFPRVNETFSINLNIRKRTPDSIKSIPYDMEQGIYPLKWIRKSCNFRSMCKIYFYHQNNVL